MNATTVGETHTPQLISDIKSNVSDYLPFGVLAFGVRAVIAIRLSVA